jgi:AAA domain, putative AbiEii toxin, Type IV TA system
MRIRQFKGFADSGNVPLARITLILGANSSGKTALLQPLLMLAQSVSGVPTYSTASLELNGPLTQLGDYRELVRNHHGPTMVRLSLGFTSRFWEDLQLSPPLAERTGPIHRTNGRFEYQLELKYHANAERVTAERVFYRTLPSGTTLTRKGSEVRWAGVPGLTQGRMTGRFATADILNVATSLPSVPSPDRRDQPSDIAINRAIISDVSRRFAEALRFELTPLNNLAPHRDAPQRFYLTTSTDRLSSGDNLAARTRRLQSVRESEEWLQQWLHRLGIASSIDARKVAEGLLVLHLTDATTGVTSNVADFGFGTSQLLPLLIMSAPQSQGRRSRGLIIAQQPEVHLHPTAQGAVADLFIQVTSNGLQAIVETHSEQLVRVVQRRVADRTLRPEEVSILFVHKSPSGSEVIPLTLDDYGRFIPELPTGFLDTGYMEAQEFQRIAGERAKKDVNSH